MNTPRMRTINAAAEYFREIDPDSALTKTAIRRLVTTGALPCVMVGTKYLISLESLEGFLENGGAVNGTVEQSGIRRIEV